MKLRSGDRIVAHVAGRTGEGIVTRDQDGPLVWFRWDGSAADAPACVAMRDKCSYVPSTGPLQTSLDELAGNSREFRRMGSFLRLSRKE